jgi:hypothetical protein
LVSASEQKVFSGNYFAFSTEGCSPEKGEEGASIGLGLFRPEIPGNVKVFSGNR